MKAVILIASLVLASAALASPLTITGLTSGTATGAGPWTTASISPAANATVIILIGRNDQNGPTAVSGGGFAGWTKDSDSPNAGNSLNVSAWIAREAAPGSGTITITGAGTRCAWSVVSVTGAYGTSADDAIRTPASFDPQGWSASGSGTDMATTLSASGTSFPGRGSSGNVLVQGWTWPSTAAFTPGSGATQIHAVTDGAGLSLGTQWVEVDTFAATKATSGVWASAFVDVRAPGAVATGTPVLLETASESEGNPGATLVTGGAVVSGALSVLVALVASKDPDAGEAPSSLVGYGATWVKRAEGTYGSTLKYASLWTGTTPAAGAGSLTITWPSDQAARVVVIVEVPSADGLTPVGVSASASVSAGTRGQCDLPLVSVGSAVIHGATDREETTVPDDHALLGQVVVDGGGPPGVAATLSWIDANEARPRWQNDSGAGLRIFGVTLNPQADRSGALLRVGIGR